MKSYSAIKNNEIIPFQCSTRIAGKSGLHFVQNTAVLQELASMWQL